MPQETQKAGLTPQVAIGILCVFPLGAGVHYFGRIMLGGWAVIFMIVAFGAFAPFFVWRRGVHSAAKFERIIVQVLCILNLVATLIVIGAIVSWFTYMSRSS